MEPAPLRGHLPFTHLRHRISCQVNARNQQTAKIKPRPTRLPLRRNIRNQKKMAPLASRRPKRPSKKASKASCTRRSRRHQRSSMPDDRTRLLEDEDPPEDIMVFRPRVIDSISTVLPSEHMLIFPLSPNLEITPAGRISSQASEDWRTGSAPGVPALPTRHTRLRAGPVQTDHAEPQLNRGSDEAGLASPLHCQSRSVARSMGS